MRGIDYELEPAHNAIIYALAGSVLVRAGGDGLKLPSGHALALHHSDGGQVRIEALNPGQILILAGPENNEPVISEGPFIMNNPQQIADAATRYRSGLMGTLTPADPK